MLSSIICFIFFISSFAYCATIAIIDTGFDLDHDFLSPKISNLSFDQNVEGWNFHDNNHLKKSVIEDKATLQEILLYRNLRAKGHREGLSVDEFEWFKKHSTNKDFMSLAKKFKKHSHGTFVAGIALREGENINIFPIRGLSIPSPVVAIDDNTPQLETPILSKTPEEKFKEKLKQSAKRVSKKFAKICHYVSLKGIRVVNASYGISYKSITVKFQNEYKKLTGTEIDQAKLTEYVDQYFNELYSEGKKVIERYPKILFVFSAGNTGLDNDLYHHYPSKIKTPNTIAVAAMNGDYLAGFSNYGKSTVDLGAPGVAILSILPKVYSENGVDTYSPASGTSMAAPHIANLVAQILNMNQKLKTSEIKKIILETGIEKNYLKEKLISSAMVDNKKALKAALLSRDMGLSVAINLAKSNLIPMEDSISFGQSPAISAEQFTEKVLNSIPQAIAPTDIDETPVLETEGLETTPTKPESSKFLDQGTKQQDNLVPPASAPQDDLEKSSDQSHSNQNVELSLKPSAERPASSSQSPLSLPEAQIRESLPSSPQ